MAHMRSGIPHLAWHHRGHVTTTHRLQYRLGFFSVSWGCAAPSRAGIAHKFFRVARVASSRRVLTSCSWLRASSFTCRSNSCRMPCCKLWNVTFECNGEV